MSRKGLSPSAAAALYQVAGSVTSAPDLLTDGQRDRLRELLLNVLANPERYTAKLIRIEHDLAVAP